MVVGVEDVFLIAGVAGDMDLGDALGRYGVDVVHGVEVVIHGGDVDVVDVEEDAAIGALDDFVEELPLGHFGGGKFGVAADVFYGYGGFDEVLDFADAGGGFFYGFPGIRQRE